MLTPPHDVNGDVVPISSYRLKRTARLAQHAVEQRRLQQLEADLARSNQDLAILQDIIVQGALTGSPMTPPPHVVKLWRTELHDYTPVIVTIDGTQVTLMIEPEAYPADPTQEAVRWNRWVNGYREARGI